MNGDVDGCVKVILTKAAQEACVMTGPAALACYYLAPVIVDALYPYGKALLNGLVLDVGGGFLDAIGVDLSSVMAHEIFSGDNEISKMAPGVIEKWTQAVAGIEAVWKAARSEVGLPAALVAIDPALVAESVSVANHSQGFSGVISDVIARPMLTRRTSKSSGMSARQAMLSWLYAYNEGWSKSKVTDQYSSNVNGKAQVWTVNQPDGYPPEDAAFLRGPLGLMTGGFPEDCNSGCRTSLIFGASACWRYRLDALATAMIFMTQVIVKQVTEEKNQESSSTLGTAVRLGTGAAVIGGAGYGVYRALLWLLPRLLGRP
jgi:hypothetical protein